MMPHNPFQDDLLDEKPWFVVDVPPLQDDDPPFLQQTVMIPHCHSSAPFYDMENHHSSSSHDSAHQFNTAPTAPDVLAAASALTKTSAEQGDQLDLYSSNVEFDIYKFLTAGENNGQHVLAPEPPLAPNNAWSYQPSDNRRPALDRTPHPVRSEADSQSPYISYEYGTDNSFENNVYKPPANQQPIKEDIRPMINNAITYVSPEPSTCTRSPTSVPTPNSMQTDYSPSVGVDVSGSSTSQSFVNELVDKDQTNGVQNSGSTSPRKRGRGKRVDGHENDDDNDDSGKKPSPGPCRMRAKRRKSSATPSKEPRKNFTPEEKRLNHAGSEQARRSQLSLAYESVASLVPELRGGKHTKADVLGIAAQWLEDLMAGNAELQAQLDSLPKAGNDELDAQPGSLNS